MKFQMWDSKLDIIVFDAKPLLPENHPVVMDNSPWAYALNTEKGFFHKSKHKAFLENDDLLLTTELGTEVLFANVTIWPQHYYGRLPRGLSRQGIRHAS